VDPGQGLETIWGAPMGVNLAGLERAERRFRGDIWSTAPADAITEAGVQMQRFGPVLATVFADLPATAGMNVVQGAAEQRAVSTGHLVEAIEWVREWEVDFLIAVTARRPETRSAEAWLASHGYEQGAVVRKYVRGAKPPVRQETPGIEVRELEPGETEGMSYLASESLGLPDLAGFLFCDLPELEGWHCYVAVMDGLEVACGSMLLADGIATLGIDATAELARGRGCHSALLARRLEDAAEAGCHTVLAEACDEPGQGGGAARNLQRAGFVEAGRSVFWRQPAPARA
jgi:GNAT superfamily N-acetyltransferase